MSLYESTFQKNKYNLATAANQSRTWFQQQAALLSRQNITPQRLITSSAERNVTRIVPGELYLFAYDAKHQETLPHWDMFPLVFPFRKLKDGFIGLNMHYLPYHLRIRLLDQLMSFKTGSGMTEDTRLKLSWNTIMGVSKMKIAEACVHRYLLAQVQSPFKKIGAEDWTTALMLPVERFVGSPKQQIWSKAVR